MLAKVRKRFIYVQHDAIRFISANIRRFARKKRKRVSKKRFVQVSLPNIHLDRSLFWQGFIHDFYKNHTKDDPFPNPRSVYYLNELQAYGDNASRTYYLNHHSNLNGFENNKVERSINIKVGANPNDKSNYTHSWYVYGSDIEPDSPEK